MGGQPLDLLDAHLPVEHLAPFVVGAQRLRPGDERRPLLGRLEDSPGQTVLETATSDCMGKFGVLSECGKAADHLDVVGREVEKSFDFDELIAALLS